MSLYVYLLLKIVYGVYGVQYICSKITQLGNLDTRLVGSVVWYVCVCMCVRVCVFPFHPITEKFPKIRIVCFYIYQPRRDVVEQKLEIV